MVKYTIIIGSDSLGRLIKLLLHKQISHIPRDARAMAGAERIERRVLPSLLNSFIKKLADLLKLVINGDDRSWLYPPKIFVKEGQLADEIKIEFEAKAGLLREITKFLNDIISSEHVDIDVRDIKARNIVVIRLKVSPNVLGLENIPEFQLENSNKTYLANLLKIGFERSQQFGAKEAVREAKEAIKPSAPVEPPKPPREEVAHVSEVERIANRLQAEETYLFKEAGRPDSSFKIFSHATSRFGTGICYSNMNEDMLKELVKELASKDIDFWWISSEFSQSKLRGGKYNVTSGNLGSPTEEKGIYSQLIKKVEAHKGTIILLQVDWLLKAPVRPSAGEIMNFLKQLMRKIKGETAALILVFVISPALNESERNLLGEIVNLLPKGNIIEV